MPRHRPFGVEPTSRSLLPASFRSALRRTDPNQELGQISRFLSEAPRTPVKAAGPSQTYAYM